MPLTPSSTVEEQECAIERLLASVRRQMDKVLGEVANDPISEGEVERLTGPVGPSQTMRESSPEIDTWKPWVEGPKGKKVSYLVVVSWPKLTLLQYLKLQMRYNTDSSLMFIAYSNAKFAESGDDSTWRNAKASEKACTTCVRRGNTCLRHLVSMYSDVDLRTCVWCQEWSVRCSIAQQGQSSGEGRRRVRADKGKEWEEVDEEEAEDESEDEGHLQKKARTGDEGGVEALVEQTTEVRAEVSSEEREEGEVREEESAHPEPRASLPEDGAALVIEAIRELTEVCCRGFDDMREELAGLWEDRALFRRVAEDYLQQRRWDNLAALAGIARRGSGDELSSSEEEWRRSWRW